MRRPASGFVLRLLTYLGFNVMDMIPGGYVSELEVDIISAAIYSVPIRYAKAIVVIKVI
jgi:hypothetical protein